MLNYIKFLFRKKLVKTFSGKIDWVGEDYQTNFTFYCYEGYLGKSWEFTGILKGNKAKNLTVFKDVKIWLEN